MTEDPRGRSNPSELRQRAEERLAGVGGEGVAEESAELTLHELRVHQIELEMQNDELRRAQAELERSRSRYFDLYDRAPVGFCSLDGVGAIVEANLAAEAMLGLARGEARHRKFSQYIHREDQDAYYLHHKRLTQTGEAQTFELRMTGPGGAPIRVSVTETAAQNEGDEPGFRVALSDISDLKRAEEEQLRLQDQLQQSQKMESVGRLAGGVAHDFNNMLLIILGYTEMALQSVGPGDELHVGLLEIQRAAQRSADLTSQLLAFARRQAVMPRVLNLDATVKGTLRMLRRLIGEDIELEWHPAAGLWPVQMDPSQIDQILTNLCVNARDAISGTGRITIEAGNFDLDESQCKEHPGAQPGAYVRLSVKDTGCGIGKDIQPLIFEPFFTTKAVGEGTGLGLSTVYGIVQQNHGFVEVVSERGDGAKFDVYLPRYEGGSAAAVSTREVPMPRGHETILLVEDEAAILKIAELWLVKQGYSVLAAATPREAIRLAEQHRGEIDMLMTDVVMPEMNGHDIARELLALNPRMKCLFMSGYTADIIADHGVLEAGLNFLEKPFTLRDLAEKVRQALDRDPAGGGE